MTDSFYSLIQNYAKFLMRITRQVLVCAPIHFVAAVPMVVISQLTMILAFMLPLKIIILLGSDRVPRYLAAIVPEMSRDSMILYLGIGALVFLVTHVLSDRLVTGLSQKGGEAIRQRGQKAAIFDSEDSFSKSVFERIVQTWGTLILVSVGVVAGVIVEWRLVIALMIVIVIESLFLARYWNRHRGPEYIQIREHFSQNRVRVMRALSAVNVYVALGVLVGLLLLDPEMNFIIGLILFILTRQVLQRLIVGIQDAVYLMQKQNQIEALVYPSKVYFSHQTALESTFDQQLLMSNREALFREIGQQSGLPVESLKWDWQDDSQNAMVIYHSVSPGNPNQLLRLAIYSRSQDKRLSREVLLHRSLGRDHPSYVPKMVGNGTALGRGFLITQVPKLSDERLSGRKATLRSLRLSWWAYNLTHSDLAKFARSDPTLLDKLDNISFERLSLACERDTPRAHALGSFIECLPVARQIIEDVPKILINKGWASGLHMSFEGIPICVQWSHIKLDLLGAELQPDDLTTYGAAQDWIADLDQMLGQSSGLTVQQLELTVYLAELERLIHDDQLNEAFSLLGEITPRVHSQ